MTKVKLELLISLFKLMKSKAKTDVTCCQYNEFGYLFSVDAKFYEKDASSYIHVKNLLFLESERINKHPKLSQLKSILDHSFCNKAKMVLTITQCELLHQILNNNLLTLIA
jgi:hypothetical protein